MRNARLLVSSVAVLALAACGGGDGDGPAADTGPSTAAVDGVVALEATDSLQFGATRISADTGDLTVELTCGAAVEHNFVIEETDATVAECEGGSTGSGDVSLDPGTYTYYCDIPGHRSSGMEGTLTVG